MVRCLGSWSFPYCVPKLELGNEQKMSKAILLQSWSPMALDIGFFRGFPSWSLGTQYAKRLLRETGQEAGASKTTFPS